MIIAAFWEVVFAPVVVYLVDGGFDAVNSLSYIVEKLCVVNAVEHPPRHASPPVHGDFGDEGVDDILCLVGSISDLADKFLFNLVLALHLLKELIYHLELVVEGSNFVLHAIQQLCLVYQQVGQVL